LRKRAGQSPATTYPSTGRGRASVTGRELYERIRRNKKREQKFFSDKKYFEENIFPTAHEWHSAIGDIGRYSIPYLPKNSYLCHLWHLFF
jgi:hypothetical protein